jgi:hypothetical protein
MTIEVPERNRLRRVVVIGALRRRLRRYRDEPKKLKRLRGFRAPRRETSGQLESRGATGAWALLGAARLVRRLSAGGSRIRTRGPALRRAPLTRRATRSPRSFGRRQRHHSGGNQKFRIRFLRRLGNFHVGRTRQITNSWETPRISTSKSRPCTGGRAKCQVKPPDMAARRTNSSARSGWMSKMV